jgi:hypothetical protein
MSAEQKQAPEAGANDHRETRCPRLGGPVNFQYCRQFAGEDLPCWKVFDCWWEIFDVAGFMKEILPGPDFEKLVESKPRPKILSLVELIARTRKNLSMEKPEKTKGEKP